MIRLRFSPTATRAVRSLALSGLVAVAGACGGDDDTPRAGDAASAMDTANQSHVDGMSAEQMRAAAGTMTPEQAESLGIVDTTIHVEALVGSDSTRPPAAPGAVAPASSADPGAVRDSARP